MAPLAVLPVAGPAQTLLFAVHGEDEGDFFGFSHAGVGDVNGDGYGDFVVGIRNDDDAGEDAGSVRMFSGREGRVLFTAHGDARGDLFGYAVAAIGDVDGDTVTDFVVGAPKYAYIPVSGAGFARVLSGKDGKTLRTFRGDTDRDGFGLSVGAAGDVNKDGTPDVIVGAPQYLNPSFPPGYARVLSGKDGSVLREWRGVGLLEFFGFSVDGVGDVDGDTWPDLIVGAAGSKRSAHRAGRAVVLSGQDGSVLHEVLGTTTDQFLGEAVGSVGDMDRDGRPDFAVGAYGDLTNGSYAGAVWVYSGRDKSVLHSFYGDAAEDYFGIGLRGVGDLNRDGWPDLLAGTHIDRNNHTGYARAFSGRDGAILFTLTGRAFDHFGFIVGAAGDVDADGYADLIVGAHTDYPNGKWGTGTAKVFSGRRMPLGGDTHEMSLSGGGSHVLQLEAGNAHGSSFYLVVGSVSGTRPGIGIGGSLTLPLNWDAYLDRTLSQPNSFPLLSSLGQLDSAGRAQARFTLLPGTPAALAGLTAHHAYVLFTPAGLTFVSNPVPLTLVR